MKTIRKHLETISITLAFSLFFVSCTKDRLSSSNQHVVEANHAKSSAIVGSNSVENLTGEQWFNSIYWVYGSATEHIPSLAKWSNQLNFSNSGTEFVQFENQINSLTNYINNVDSEFFDSFKERIESNNLSEIKEALLEGGNHFTEGWEVIALDSSVVTRSDVTKTMHSYNLGSDHINQSVAIWIVITVVLVIAIAINVNVTKTINIDPTEDDDIYLALLQPGDGVDTKGNGIDQLALDIYNLD